MNSLKANAETNAVAPGDTRLVSGVASDPVARAQTGGGK